MTNYLGDREPHASRGPHVGQLTLKARKESMGAPNSRDFNSAICCASSQMRSAYCSYIRLARVKWTMVKSRRK